MHLLKCEKEPLGQQQINTCTKDCRHFRLHNIMIIFSHAFNKCTSHRRHILSFFLHFGDVLPLLATLVTYLFTFQEKPIYEGIEMTLHISFEEFKLSSQNLNVKSNGRGDGSVCGNKKTVVIWTETWNLCREGQCGKANDRGSKTDDRPIFSELTERLYGFRQCHPLNALTFLQLLGFPV